LLLFALYWLAYPALKKGMKISAYLPRSLPGPTPNITGNVAGRRGEVVCPPPLRI
jgi:hypothetical protein